MLKKIIALVLVLAFFGTLSFCTGKIMEHQTKELMSQYKR
jgi:hypothetical protein